MNWQELSFVFKCNRLPFTSAIQVVSCSMEIKRSQSIKLDFSFYLPQPDRPCFLPLIALFSSLLLRVYKTAPVEQEDKKCTYLFNNIKEGKTAGSSILLLSCSKGSKYQLTRWLRKIFDILRFTDISKLLFILA